MVEELNALVEHNDQAGRGGSAPCRQPRPCAEDALERDHECGHRPGATTSAETVIARGAHDAPPDRPPPRPRPRRRPPRLGAQPRATSGPSIEAVERAVAEALPPMSASTSTGAEGRRGRAYRAAGSGRAARQPDRECRQIWWRQRVRDRRRARRASSRSWSRTTAAASPRPNASASSIAACGWTPASPARAWASPSCATWPKSMMAPWVWKRARAIRN